ncbi:MAG: deoxyribose-phosphate aldolase [Bryobacteraceae bacterium]
MDQDRAPLTDYASLASRLELPLLRMELTEDDVHDGCNRAADFSIGAVVVRPSDVDTAVRALRGTDVAVTSVVSFPHGNATTPTKLYEARDLIRRGVKEINAVINTSKLVSRQFAYLETELTQLTAACRPEGVVLKVLLVLPPLNLEYKIVGCRLAKRAEADYLAFAPATVDDVKFFYERTKWRIKLKAGGNVATLDQALEMYTEGAERIETVAVAEILTAWRKRLAEQQAATVTAT